MNSIRRVHQSLISGIVGNDLHEILWKVLRKEPQAWRELIEKSQQQLSSDDEKLFISILDPDQAMTAAVEATDKRVGGINFDPALLDLQIKRDGKGVPLPFPQQPADMRIEGFLPVIINVTPINLPLVLGLVDEGEKNRQETSHLRLQPLDVHKRQVAILN